MFRIRIIRKSGEVSVRDYSHSQACELMIDASREQWIAFCKGDALDLALGNFLLLNK